MKIEAGKVYVTSSGRRIKVLCVDAPGVQPVIGVDINTGDADKFTAEGGFYGDGSDSSLDLVSEYVEPPKPREIWVNCYPDGTFGRGWKTSEEAMQFKSGGIKALFREVIE